MAAELIPMPVSPADLYRVNRFYPFEEGGKRLLLVVDNAAFAEADGPAWTLAHLIDGKARVQRSELERALAAAVGLEEARETLHAFEQLEILEPFGQPRMAPDLAGQIPPLTSLVLHVSHDCNLRCGYCYADFGRYGGDYGVMTEAMAEEHAARFFDQLGDSRSVHVTFFGGEPLMNMPVVYAAHRYTKARAEREGRRISYGLTTNGTLLTDDIVAYFVKERFTITVSIDGPPDVNDRLRTLQGGGGSYDRIMERVRSTGLDAIARVTLTRRSTDVARIVRHLVSSGFREVGMSPVASGDARFDLDRADLEKVLAGLRDLADDFVAWAKEGRVFPFSNIKGVVEQVAAGDPRAVPCGAGTRLVAADNKGDLYACHRLVGEAQFKLGDVHTGVDPEARAKMLSDMHPRGREPCGECWARYLCGGGCHHIAWLHTAKGAAPWTIGGEFCDFLRSWYRVGLHTYARMLEEAPDTLARLSRGRGSSCGQATGM